MSERLINFREVIRPPLWLMSFIYFLALSLGIAIWAAMNTMAAVIVMALLTASTILVYFTSSLVIEIDDLKLRVGNAHIDKKFCGEVSVLTPAQMSLQRTRDADPAAFLAIRFWTAHGVKIEVNDDRDQTPYWLVTSKRGEKLAQALKNI
jgi:general stress protein CsbA